MTKPLTPDRRVNLSVSLPLSTVQLMDAAVTKHGTTTSAFIRESITLHLLALSKKGAK